MIDSVLMENIRASIRRYEQLGPDFMSQSQHYTKVLFEEVETLRKALSGRLQDLEDARADVHRLSLRCAALACLLYPNPDAMPREAVAEDFGLHPSTDPAK